MGKLTKNDYRKLIFLLGEVWSVPDCTAQMKIWIKDKIDELYDDLGIYAQEVEKSFRPQEDQFAYALWRFEYYLAAGNMTYTEIDRAVAEGTIQFGDMPCGHKTE